jgi:hypothetical protein
MFGLSDEDIYGDQQFQEPIGPDDNNGPDEPDPTSPAGAGLVIRAPRGPQPVKQTFSVYAVVEEIDPETGEPEIVAGQVLATGLRMATAGDAVAYGHSLRPDDFSIPATAVVCNDGAGRTLRHYPVLRLAG